MRVGVYCPERQPIDGGGYTYQTDILLSISEIASESKHQFVIFASADLDKIQHIVHPDSVQVVKIPKYPSFPKGIVKFVKQFIGSKIRTLNGLPGSFDSYCYSNRFEETARSEHIDLLWFPSPVHIPVNIPYIATIWDLEHRKRPYFPEVSDGGAWRNREIFFSNYLQRATMIIVGTVAGREEIACFYQIPDDRIWVLPLPTPRFSLSELHGDGRDVINKYGIPHEYLIYPAQFWPHKNHANLLLALQILIEKFNVILPVVFVGSDKGNEGYIRKLTSELGLTKQVFFLGFIPKEDLIHLYKNAIALTYMTFFGPDNLPPLEAFALGCPVIASDITGSEEQLGDGAIFVDPKDPEMIAKAIFDIYSSQDLRQSLIERGLIRAKSWTAQDLTRNVLLFIDEFDAIRRCWD